MSNDRHATALAGLRYTDADSALARVVLERTDVLRAERRVLHIGPHDELREMLSTLPQLEYCGIEGPRGVLGGPVLPYVSESFDLVICDEGERGERQLVSLGEVARLLRPGGRAVMRTGLPYEAFASKASAEGLFVVRGESHDGSGDDEVFLCVRGEY